MKMKKTCKEWLALNKSSATWMKVYWKEYIILLTAVFSLEGAIYHGLCYIDNKKMEKKQKEFLYQLKESYR